MRTVCTLIFLIICASFLFVFVDCHAEDEAGHTGICLLACCNHPAPVSVYIFTPPQIFILLHIADDLNFIRTNGLEIEHPPRRG